MNQISLSIELNSAKACQALRAFLDVMDSADVPYVSDAVQSSSQEESAQSSLDEKSKGEQIIKLLEEQIDDLKKELSRKNEEIKSLNQQLDRFVPNFTNDEKVKFLNVSDGELELTNNRSAPFIAVEINGGVCFKFNVEKGLCKEACKDRDKIIKPFCDIVEECEDANEIINVEPGMGEWISSQDRLRVHKIAKVKLIKQ